MTDKSGKYPSVSVIILNYNGKAFVERCLNSVLDTNYPNFEVIFVDNASTDGSADLVKKLFSSDKRLKIIRNNENLGTAGYNVGVSASVGEYVVFLHIDEEVDQRWLEELIKSMISDQTIGVAQSKMLLMYGRKRLDCAGCFIDCYGWTYKRGEGEKDENQYEQDEIFYSMNGGMAIKKDLLDKIGGYDPKFFCFYEETDLCWRVWLNGYKVVFVPTSVVYHAVGGATKRMLLPILTFHMSKNHIATLLKNYSIRNLARYLPAYLVLACGMAAYLMLRGEIKGTTAYIKAILWNLLNLKYIWKKRLKVQYLIRKIPDGYLFKKRLIFSKPLLVLKFLQGLKSVLLTCS